MSRRVRHQEYAALRATIRERGTVRVIMFLATVLAWAALEAWVLASGPRDAVPIVVTLLVLGAGFEAVFQLHVGVERIGRYLQVAFEEGEEARIDGDPPRWETTVMAFGRAHPGAGSDPLFFRVFLVATVVNALPALRAWRTPGLFAVLTGLHLLVLLRMALAKAVAADQRMRDLERFRALVHGTPVPAAATGAETPPGPGESA